MAAIAECDHSVSVPELGSIFHYDRGTAIAELQEGIAEIYQVPFAWPSPNGTTALNVLSLMTATAPGDEILVQRDSHLSIYAPMIHMGLRPIYLCPHHDRELGMNLGITAEQIQEALEAHPHVRAVFLTYPNYHGIATDIQACARVVRAWGLPLIIDSAHGAYLRFHPALPGPAERTGAAITTLSTHKTGAALSQGSVALFHDEKLIRRFYEMVNQLGFISTSFSYVILLSISFAVRQLDIQGRELLSRAMDASDYVRTEINRIDGLRCFGRESTHQGTRPGFMALDPLRITVDVSRLGLTGFEVEHHLIKRYRVYPEMASLQHVLFLMTPADNLATGQRIIQTLTAIARHRPIRAARYTLATPALPRQLVRPREAFYGAKRRLPIQAAIGEVCAETIAAFPPGSALIVTGEEITQEVVDFLSAIRRRGGVLKGASDPEFATIQVLDS
jgi:ornithine decarboxylase